MDKKFVILLVCLSIALTLTIFTVLYQQSLLQPLDPGTTLATPELEQCSNFATKVGREKTQMVTGDEYTKIWKEAFNDCYQK